MGRRPLPERLDSCVSCVEEATKDVTGFRLSVTPTWNAQDEALWTSLEEDDSWASVLFVPSSLAIKTGAVQSTLFEHSGVDFKDIANSLTDSIARPDLLDDCRGAWHEDTPADGGPSEAVKETSSTCDVSTWGLPAAPGETRVFVQKTYSQAITHGVGPAEKPAGEEEGGPAPAGDVAEAT